MMGVTLERSQEDDDLASYVEKASIVGSWLDRSIVDELLLLPGQKSQSLKYHMRRGVDVTLAACLKVEFTKRRWDHAADYVALIGRLLLIGDGARGGAPERAANRSRGRTYPVPPDLELIERLISRTLAFVQSLFVGYYRGRIATPPGPEVVATFGAMCDLAGRKCLRKVMTRGFCDLLKVAVTTTGCRTAREQLILPLVCLWERLPGDCRRRILTPSVAFEMARLLSSPGEGRTKERLAEVFRSSRLGDFVEENYTFWRELGRGCSDIQSDLDCGLEAVARFLGRNLVSTDEAIDCLLMNSLDRFLVEGDRGGVEGKNVRRFLGAFLSVSDPICGRTPFENLLDLLKDTVARLGEVFLRPNGYQCRECARGGCAKAGIKHSVRQTMRLLYKLFHLNDSWYQWLDEPRRPRLVDRKRFEMFDVDSVAHLPRGADVSGWFSSVALTCPPLLTYRMRRSMFDASRLRRLSAARSDGRADFYRVPRSEPLDFLRVLLDRLPSGTVSLRLAFEDEIAWGDGPTREVYSLVSREFQRHDLELWLGDPEPAGSSPGEVSYTRACSPGGLYPRPGGNSTYERWSRFELLGKTLAWAVKDGHVLDIPLSTEFFRLFVAGDRQEFRRAYYDLDGVLPVGKEFVDQLVSIKRQKGIIERSSLEPEEKRRLVDRLRLDDGSSLEDLCLSFTLPGRPEVLLEENGSDVILSPRNVERYLDGLASAVRFERDRAPLEWFQNGFNSVFYSFFGGGGCTGLDAFTVEELPRIFCGQEFEEWTPEYLESVCQLVDYTADSAPVRFLFEVLSSLDGPERSLFLKFVTASPRLPCGGLRKIRPPLTVVRSDSEAEADTRLPTASTCFNRLRLPEYSSLEVTRRKLLYAVTECVDSFQFV